QGAGNVGRSARAAGERMPVGVVGLGECPSEPAIDLPARRVAGLPDSDRLEVREGRVRVAHSLHDGDLALVPQGLDAAEVVIEPEVRGKGQSLRHHRARELGTQVVQRRVREGNQRAQPVVATGELDHHEHVVVGDAVLLGRVDSASECVRYRRVAGGQSRRTGSEYKAGLQEIAPLELVDADLFTHLTCTYLSWNSGEARVTNHRDRSSGAWVKSLAVCGLSTPSRCC